MRSQINKVLASLSLTVPMMVLLFGALNPPKALAVPSYARQTGLACSGCHYAPPELNPAGRRFKLLGYVDRGDDTKTVKAEGGKSRAALDLLASLPLSVMFETSFTATNSPVPATQNGSFQIPQDISLFLSGAWTSHVGSFLQVTYETQDDHFTSDNTDIRFANKTKLSGKELVYGLDLNNNPTVEDLWNDTPAWGYPWIASNVAPTPTATPIINGGLAQDVAGFGGYAMWNDHLYLNVDVYRSQHVGGPEPNPGIGSTYNIVGVAPYWRLAWQESTGTTQFEIGTYGMHMKTTPNGINNGINDRYDGYTDWAFDTQYDRTLFRKDVLSLRGTYIRENSQLGYSCNNGLASVCGHHSTSALVYRAHSVGSLPRARRIPCCIRRPQLAAVPMAIREAPDISRTSPIGRGRICRLPHNIPDTHASMAAQPTTMARVGTRAQITPFIWI
jgi:hypothetical protein